MAYASFPLLCTEEYTRLRGHSGCGGSTPPVPSDTTAASVEILLPTWRQPFRPRSGLFWLETILSSPSNINSFHSLHSHLSALGISNLHLALHPPPLRTSLISRNASSDRLEPAPESRTPLSYLNVAYRHIDSPPSIPTRSAFKSRENRRKAFAHRREKERKRESSPTSIQQPTSKGSLQASRSSSPQLSPTPVLRHPRPGSIAQHSHTLTRRTSSLTRAFCSWHGSCV